MDVTLCWRLPSSPTEGRPLVSRILPRNQLPRNTTSRPVNGALMNAGIPQNVEGWALTF